MRRYTCPVCTTEVHFDNTACVTCGAELVFVPTRDAFATPGAAEPCDNRAVIACNWAADDSGLCASCAHTAIIPDLTIAGNAAAWARLETAKRMLFHSLARLKLPLAAEGGPSLRFAFKGDLAKPDGTVERVLTGHDQGEITVNIAEADDVVRERNRAAMGEPYRALIGHFRHEAAHFYWDVLVAREPVVLERSRATFGDETADYGSALTAHYAKGPMPGWERTHVSAYATAHPWEDFAETFAHYLHMVDGLDTAGAYGLDPDGVRLRRSASQGMLDPYTESDMGALLEPWIPLTVAMNAVNRSIGNRDFYPFVLSETIMAKLRFVHDLIRART